MFYPHHKSLQMFIVSVNIGAIIIQNELSYTVQKKSGWNQN